MERLLGMIEAPWFSKHRVSNLSLAALLGVGLYLCYLLAIPFIAALVWSATLAILFAPVDASIRRSFRSENLSAVTSVAIVAFIVVVPSILVIGTLLNESVRNASLIIPLIESATKEGIDAPHPLLARALQWINERLDLVDLLRASSSALAQWSGSIVSTSFTGVVSLLLTFYFLFYLLRDRAKALAAARDCLPLREDEFTEIADRVVDTVIATVWGTAAVAALQGGLGGVMFWWLGLPAPVLWGVLMGLLAIVPFLSVFVIWVPTTIYLALTGQYGSAIILAIWGTLVVTIVGNVIYPILVGNRLKLHTIVSFIALVGGVIVFGGYGIVLGPVIVAIALTLVDIWRRRTAAAA